MHNLILETKMKHKDEEILKFQTTIEELKSQMQKDTSEFFSQLEETRENLTKMIEKCDQKDSEIQKIKEEIEREK